MYTLRRAAAVVVCALAFALPLSAQPALAAEPARPWVGNPDGLPVGDNGTVPLEQGAGSTWTFGTKGGTNLREEVTMTIPDYPGLSVAPIGSGCAPVTSGVRCEGPVDAGTFSGQALITIDASTPLGYAGQVTVSTPDGGAVKTKVWVISHSKGADLEVRIPEVAGNVGDTVGLAITVTNLGPSPEPAWAIDDVQAPPGTVLTGQHGCSPGTFSTIPVACAHSAYMAVGATVTVTFDLKIVEATNPYVSGGFGIFEALQDPNTANTNVRFVLRVGSGSGVASGPGRPGSPGGSVGAPVTAGVPTPLETTADATPSPSVDTTPARSGAPGIGPAVQVSNQRTLSSRWFWVSGTGIALLVGLLAVSMLRMRRRPALASTTAVDTTAAMAESQLATPPASVVVQATDAPSQ